MLNQRVLSGNVWGTPFFPHFFSADWGENIFPNRTSEGKTLFIFLPLSISHRPAVFCQDLKKDLFSNRIIERKILLFLFRSISYLLPILLKELWIQVSFGKKDFPHKKALSLHLKDRAYIACSIPYNLLTPQVGLELGLIRGDVKITDRINSRKLNLKSQGFI